MYKWMLGNSFKKVATVYEGNITFNMSCISLFENAKWCMIGIDEQNKKVGIKIISVLDIKNRKVPQDNVNRISVGKSFIRISNKSIINEIENLLNESITNSKFSVGYNKKDEIIEINLNEKIFF